MDFTCPYCGRFTEVADKYVGRTGPCAGCGRTVTIAGPAAALGGPPAAPPRRSAALTVLLVLGAMCLCGSPILVALLLPAVSAARESARRMSCSNNLKQIALAMHNYHAVHGCLPAGYVADEEGRPLHSWRVAILPFLDSYNLAEGYNFDEPWNSPGNRQFAHRMPPVFRCPSSPQGGPETGLTNYVVVLGDRLPNGKRTTVFGPNSWTKFQDIRDGTSQTLLVIETRNPVPWTQPDADPTWDMVQSVGVVVGSHHPGGGNAAMADGSVHFLSELLSAAVFRQLVQPDDGQYVEMP